MMADIDVRQAEPSELPAATVATELREHSRFYNNLVQLIPSKYYLEEDKDHISIKHLNKSEKLATKRLLKQKRKHNKRQKLDPDAPSTTLEQQQIRFEKGKQTDAKNIDGLVNAKPNVLTLHFEAGSLPSRDTLRDRLQKKLQAFRAQRKLEQQAQSVQHAKQWREDARLSAIAKSHKRKVSTAPQVNQNAATKGETKPTQAQAKHDAAAEEIHSLAFGKLEVGIGQQHRKMKKNEVQLLKEAEAKVQKKKALQNSQEGKSTLHQEAWSVALAKAHGDKVLDDPKLLRRSIKKDTKLKQKKAKEWQQRTEKQKEEMEARQTKRKDNLDKRANAKIAKKKSKRENKLLRAGFEGRKATFIETAKA